MAAVVPDLRRALAGAKKGPLARASFLDAANSSAVMTMPAMGPMVPNGSAAREPDLLQFEAGDAGGDVQAGLALHADRLQGVGILRPAEQKVTAPPDADRCIGADAAITAGEFAASDPAGRRIHRPGKLGLLGDTDIQAEAAHGGGVRLGTAAFALENAFEAG